MKRIIRKTLSKIQDRLTRQDSKDLCKQLQKCGLTWSSGKFVCHEFPVFVEVEIIGISSMFWNLKVCVKKSDDVILQNKDMYKFHTSNMTVSIPEGRRQNRAFRKSISNVVSELVVKTFK